MTDEAFFTLYLYGVCLASIFATGIITAIISKLYNRQGKIK